MANRVRAGVAVAGTIVVTMLLSGAGANARSAAVQARASGVTVRAQFSRSAALSRSAVINALAAEGVGVYASTGSTRPEVNVSAPVTPLRVLDAQAQSMSAELEGGGGTIGADLNSLVAMPAHAPPFAYLLAAYAQSTQTPGERLAGELLGNQDWSHPETIVFPSLVLTLFAADAARAYASHSVRQSAADMSAPEDATTADAASSCASIADWISSGLGKFFNLLTVNASSNPALAFIGGIWNKGVALASTAVNGIVAKLTSAAQAAIRNGLALAGMASVAISAIRNLTLTLSATPASNAFGVAPAAGNAGAVKATLGSPNGLDVPAFLKSCAQSFGFDLSGLNDVKGDKVTWTTTNTGSGATLATVKNQDGELGSDHTATLTYTTSIETADQVARGALISGDYYRVKATVTPSVFQKLLKLVEAITLGRVPGATQVVDRITQNLKAALLSKVASLVNPTDYRYIQIEHHGPPPLLASGVSCDTLLSMGQFPGATTLDGPSNTTDGQVWTSQCTYQDCSNPSYCNGDETPPNDGGFDELVTEPDVEGAILEFDGLGTGTAISGVGDQAVSFPPDSSGDSIAAVRVANDVFEVIMGSGGDATSVLPQVVGELCPACKFPTGPYPRPSAAGATVRR